MTGGGGGSPIDAGPPPEPQTTITTTVGGPLSAGAEMDIVFICDQGICTFECALDQAAFAPCTSPATRGPFSDGAHQFSVRATRDGVTDATPAILSFQVDAVIPVVGFQNEAVDGTNAEQSDFVFECSEAPCLLECSLDNASFVSCPYVMAIDGLAPGTHSMVVRGTDAAGNVSATQLHRWTLTFGWREADMTATTACAISGERKLYCWGVDANGQLGNNLPPSTEGAASTPIPTRVGTARDWDRIVAGQNFFCGSVKSGGWFCWGSNIQRLFGDPSIAAASVSEPTSVPWSFKELSVGEQAACALDDQGRLSCWGNGDYGALGDGNDQQHMVLSPQAVGSAQWRSISTWSHTCGVKTDGSLWCFGRNHYGQTGQMASTAISVPTRVGTDVDWDSVAVATDTTCARKQDGRVLCFGSATNGMLGNGATSSNYVPMPVTVSGSPRNFFSIHRYAAGFCGGFNDGFECWGEHKAGELGTANPTPYASYPTAVATPTILRRIFGRERLRCAMTSEHQLECWGDNVDTRGGLGRGVKGVETTVVELESSWQQLSMTASLLLGRSMGGCGIRSNGALACWGTGLHVAPSGLFEQFTVQQIGTNTDWVQVKLSPISTSLTAPLPPTVVGHACGVRSGQLFCWGRNGVGQLGTGNTVDATALTAVAPPSGVTWSRVALGTNFTCALTSNNRIWCWGGNASGQLGDGTTVAHSSKAEVAGHITDWVDVVANGDRVTARRANGTAYHWGQGLNTAPTQVSADTDWTSVAPGNGFTCGRRNNSTLWCRATSQSAVEQASPFTDVASVLDFGSCFLRSGGAVACVTFNGTTWVPANASLAPAGSWSSFQSVSGLGCGVLTTGARACIGTRFAGSFGDGFDQRIPGPVLVP